MANLTITVDPEVLRRARMRAIEQGTSVNAILRTHLESYAGRQDAQERAIARILELSRRSRSRSGGRKWTRDELHER